MPRRLTGASLAVALGLLLCADGAAAQVGQKIVEIQLDQEGHAVNDPAVLRLIETRVGDVLSVRSARETIAHLMALGRYEDIQEIGRAFGLQPHRTETFKLSPDPLLIEKVRDIVGLYMNPPEHALVFCVDEKSQIQALDRTQPLLPMRSVWI